MNILTNKYAEAGFDNTERLGGEYEFRVYKADGRLVRAVKTKNLLTTGGLNRYVGARTACRQYIFIGTGTTAPSFSDTTLATYKAYKQVSQNPIETNSGSPDYIAKITSYVRFAVGEATGNITEVGAGWADTSPIASNYQLFSRALIQDASSNPVTITVLADEYLDVYYSLQYYPDLADKSYGLTIGGTSYTITQHMYNITSTSRMSNYQQGGKCELEDSAYISTSATLISQTTTEGSGSWTGPLPRTYDAYVPNSFTLTGYMSVIPAVGNMAIRSIFLQSIDNSRDLKIRRQISLSTALTKTSLQELRIYQTMTVSRH